MEILIGLYFGVPTDDHDIESEKNKAFWVGLAAMVFNICMYAAPAQNILEVFKTKDQNLIPIHTSIVGFLCSFTWLSYGLLNFDINVVVPNVLGVIFTIFQIIVWIYFWKFSDKEDKKGFIEDEKSSKTELA